MNLGRACDVEGLLPIGSVYYTFPPSASAVLSRKALLFPFEFTHWSGSVELLVQQLVLYTLLYVTKSNKCSATRPFSSPGCDTSSFGTLVAV